MVIPVGPTPDKQTLLLITKKAGGVRETRKVAPVRFVPLRRPGERGILSNRLLGGAPAMNWGVIVVILAGSMAVVVIRPWRFWWSRRLCPQCRELLPRWNIWGW